MKFEETCLKKINIILLLLKWRKNIIYYRAYCLHISQLIYGILICFVNFKKRLFLQAQFSNRILHHCRKLNNL